MFIIASTKEFTLVNNAIPCHDITFEHLLYYKLAPPSHIVKSTQNVRLAHLHEYKVAISHCNIEI